VVSTKTAKRTFPLLATAVAACAATFGVVTAKAQTTAPTTPPKFEVASVRPSDSNDKKSAAMPRTWGDKTGKVSLHHIPLNYLLYHVYNLQPDQLSGPSWLPDELFDILATVAANAPKEQVPLMFQSLLAERFKLKFHRETQNAKVFALVVGKGGSKLKEAVPDDPDWKTGSKTTGSGEDRIFSESGAGDLGRYKGTLAHGMSHDEYQNMTMENLAKFFNQLPQVLGLPVVDMTGLRGSYQVTLDYPVTALRGALPANSDDASDPSGGSFLDSLHKMGLDMVRREAQTERFVIDQIEKTPTPN
jgi:uncharacterized protein (TIGR03435 family)